jgi:hypothetical protein
MLRFAGAEVVERLGTHFTRFTDTKVQILTQKGYAASMGGAHQRVDYFIR